MAKVKKAYFCRECGYDTSKWLGKCPSCGAWNSFAEEIISAPNTSVPALVASHAIEPARPQKVQEIECGKTVRLDTGNSEVNRVLGGGVVNNKVLENCGIDSSKYSGLAFGIGIERIAMLKYGINHMGKLFENGIEFLKQFKA